MSWTMTDEQLQEIAKGEWAEEDEWGQVKYSFGGEDADGIPTFEIELARPWGGWHIGFSIGDYSQYGDARTADEAVAVCKAMGAAYKTFNTTMTELEDE